ncbi:TPA: MoaD/ThiS family protein [Candidatus Woesearchaeota archaeon]|jgi:molybdopterin converting factor small subunit|nr:MoaD/ThiS family protein [Candidatus Woesearchaeota archaeon]|tara:strand:- start:526 stop:810 length:285 start_codon:yes stop_codon:yes gene_type:complete
MTNRTVIVNIPATFKEQVEEKDIVNCKGDTIREVLEDLMVQYPKIRDKLIINGNINRFVNIYLEDEDIRFLEDLETKLEGGEELTLLPAIAGGV